MPNKTPSLRLYDGTGDLRDRLVAIAAAQELTDQRGNPSASQAVVWLVEQWERGALMVVPSTPPGNEEMR